MTNAKIDAIIKKHGGEASALIQVLLDIQKENQWLPKEALSRVSQKLNVPLSRVQHAATFYKTLRVSPETQHQVHVCNGTTCHARGAQRIIDRIQEVTGIKAGETDPELKYDFEATTCVGCCGSGPAVVIDGAYKVGMDADKVQDIFKNLR